MEAFHQIIITNYESNYNTCRSRIQDSLSKVCSTLEFITVEPLYNKVPWDREMRLSSKFCCIRVVKTINYNEKKSHLK